MFTQLYNTFSRVKKFFEKGKLTFSNTFFYKEPNRSLQIQPFDEKLFEKLNNENKKLINNKDLYRGYFQLTPVLSKFAAFSIIGRNVDMVMQSKKFNDAINEQLDKNGLFSPNKKFIGNTIPISNIKFLK